MKSEIKVGIMTFAAMLILLSMTFSVGKLNPLKKLGPTIPIAFNYIGNLKLNANARISGVIIGTVKDIRLVDDKVLVKVQLNSPDIKIRDNCQIFISSEGLIGESYVDIKVVKGDAPFYNEGDPPLPGTDPVGVGEIMSDTKALTVRLQQTLDMIVSEKSRTNMDIIMTNMAESTKEMNNILKQNQSLINNIIENLNKIMIENQKNINQTFSNFNASSQEVKSTISENKEKVSSIMTNMNSLSQSLDQKTTNLADELLQLVKSLNNFSGDNQKKLASILDNMESITQKLNQMTNTFVSISEKIEKGPGTLGKLINDSKLYDNLNKTVEEAQTITPELKMTLASLRDLTDKINKGEGTAGQIMTNKDLYKNVNELIINTNKIVTKVSDIRTFWGYQLDYRFPNTKNNIKEDYKNTLIFKIEPRQGKYYKLELNDVGKEDKVSVEIGQTFFDKLVLRAGIVESTGGFGANYLLFKDRLSSGLTAFDFNSDTNNKPHLKFSNELNLFENGYLTFGVDDFINKERYYIGMRYLMEDKDIKYLMSLLSYR